MANDEFRAKLKSPRFQVPAWVAVACFLAAPGSMIWSGFTEDPLPDWIGIAASMLFMASVLTVERLTTRLFRAHTNLKG